MGTNNALSWAGWLDALRLPWGSARWVLGSSFPPHKVDSESPCPRWRHWYSLIAMHTCGYLPCAGLCWRQSYEEDRQGSFLTECLSLGNSLGFRYLDPQLVMSEGLDLPPFWFLIWGSSEALVASPGGLDSGGLSIPMHWGAGTSKEPLTWLQVASEWAACSPHPREKVAMCPTVPI